jgi:hypothetical protein
VERRRSTVARQFASQLPPCAGSSSLYIARVDRDFNFVVTGMLDREQNTTIGFVGQPPQ